MILFLRSFSELDTFLELITTLSHSCRLSWQMEVMEGLFHNMLQMLKAGTEIASCPLFKCFMVSTEILPSFALKEHAVVGDIRVVVVTRVAKAQSCYFKIFS